MFVSHRHQDAPSLANTYRESPRLGLKAAPAPTPTRHLGFIDLTEDLDIVVSVAVTLLGVASAVSAVIVQW